MPTPECPADLSCSYLPAYYGPRGGPGSADRRDVCNYDSATRPRDVAIQYVVMHDTEETYADTLKLTQGTTYCASFPYLIRSSDGHVAQTVPTSAVAWHAGNYWVNMHSLGIEQEGFLVHGPTWYSEPLYQSAAKLLRYLSARFGIPLDRGHILGHDTVPGPADQAMAGMHPDPGVAYDWSHLFDLAGAPIVARKSPRGEVITIKPDYRANTVVVSGCEPPQFGGPRTCRDVDARDLPAMSSSDVFLHTAPANNAPLVFDPYLPGQVAGNRRVENWGSRASTGQQFVVCDRRPGWKAIWYGGQKAWFADSRDKPTSLGAFATLVTPKAGKRSAPVYGTAYPRPADLPANPRVQAFAATHATVALSRYTIPAGQRYVLVGPVVTDLYFAGSTEGPTPYDRSDLHGSDRYDWIFFNHRMALVRADDVDVIQPLP